MSSAKYRTKTEEYIETQFHTAPNVGNNGKVNSDKVSRLLWISLKPTIQQTKLPCV